MSCVLASSYVRLALLMYVSGPHAPVVLVRQWFQNSPLKLMMDKIITKFGWK